MQSCCVRHLSSITGHLWFIWADVSDRLLSTILSSSDDGLIAILSYSLLDFTTYSGDLAIENTPREMCRHFPLCGAGRVVAKCVRIICNHLFRRSCDRKYSQGSVQTLPPCVEQEGLLNMGTENHGVASDLNQAPALNSCPPGTTLRSRPTRMGGVPMYIKALSVNF